LPASLTGEISSVDALVGNSEHLQGQNANNKCEIMLFDQPQPEVYKRIIR
jgi:hypothetical protein